MPSSRLHKEQVTSRQIEANRVCLHCWHQHREIHLEDEAHVLVVCPLYAKQRADFIQDATKGLRSTWQVATTTAESKLQALLNSHWPHDWKAMGRLVVRIRQLRRAMKLTMQKRCELRAKNSYATVRRTWIREGKYVCPHGVFFALPQTECPCLLPRSTADWTDAVLMPALHEDLKCIVTDTFDDIGFRRLGVLKSEMRRRNW